MVAKASKIPKKPEKTIIEWFSCHESNKIYLSTHEDDINCKHCNKDMPLMQFKILGTHNISNIKKIFKEEIIPFFLQFYDENEMEFVHVGNVPYKHDIE